MAEAEDVIVDAARHATEYAQDLWRRRRPAPAQAPLTLLDVAPALDLLLAALHGRTWPIRVAQAPAPVTLLTRVFRRQERPWRQQPVPATDGHALWLPRTLPGLPDDQARALWRAMAVQQAWRGEFRGGAGDAAQPLAPLARDLALVIEAQAADAALAAALPGLVPALIALRRHALQSRPPLQAFPPERLGVEQWVRGVLMAEIAPPVLPGAQGLAEAATLLAARWPGLAQRHAVFKDCWTGDWAAREGRPGELRAGAGEDQNPQPGNTPTTRTARLARRPQVREAQEGEDDASPGAWMIQTAQPHEHAEDPMGMQRPTDRDADSAAEAHADSVGELAEARLVRSRSASHEILLSDDPVEGQGGRAPPSPAALGDTKVLRYPEWDYKRQAYVDPGPSVWVSLAEAGPPQWLRATLEQQRGLLASIQRRFEMLRAQPVVLRRQEEGDELDIEACIDARADLRAGHALPQGLYRSRRMARRDSAIVVLVDISGSTDGWVAGQRRIIDVEKEALLALSVALDACGDPHAILAFSGDGPQRVTVREVKRFEERHGLDVGLRISGLAPERFTRAGAALRHASQVLRQRPARHQLLLLISDGKPNDTDDYEGRYGVEDMRQAVNEARQAGQAVFCLTVDRQAPTYLPRIFGAHQYALLQKPERLPVVLLDWMRRLLMQ